MAPSPDYSAVNAFRVQAYCVDAASTSTGRRYDPHTGAINGLDISLKDSADGVIYEAAVDIQRDQFGRIGTYTGTITQTTAPTFTETITNHYNEFGHVARADVAKVYGASGDAYTMTLTPCRQGNSWSGYQVLVTGGSYHEEPFVRGTCNDLPPTPTPTFTATSAPAVTPPPTATVIPAEPPTATPVPTVPPTATSAPTQIVTTPPTPTHTATATTMPTDAPIGTSIRAAYLPIVLRQTAPTATPTTAPTPPSQATATPSPTSTAIATPNCPQTGSWVGTTNQSRPISFPVSDTPSCQVESLTLNYRVFCTHGFRTRTVTISPARPILNNHFEIGSIDPEVIGDFTSQTEASGTWRSSFSHPTLGFCLDSGTWSAHYEPLR